MNRRFFSVVLLLVSLSTWAAAGVYSSCDFCEEHQEGGFATGGVDEISIILSPEILKMLNSTTIMAETGAGYSQNDTDTAQSYSYTVEIPDLQNRTVILQKQSGDVQTTQFISVQPSTDHTREICQYSDGKACGENYQAPYIGLIENVQQVYPEGSTIEFTESSNQFKILMPDGIQPLVVHAPLQEIPHSADSLTSLTIDYPVALRDRNLEILFQAGTCWSKKSFEACPYGELEPRQDGSLLFTQFPAYELANEPLMIVDDASGSYSLPLAPQYRLFFPPGLSSKVAFIGDVTAQAGPTEGNGNRGAKSSQSYKSRKGASQRGSTSKDEKKASKKKKQVRDDDGKRPPDRGNQQKRKLPADAIIFAPNPQKAKRTLEKLQAEIRELRRQINEKKKGDTKELATQLEDKKSQLARVKKGLGCLKSRRDGSDPLPGIKRRRHEDQFDSSLELAGEFSDSETESIEGFSDNDSETESISDVSTVEDEAAQEDWMDIYGDPPLTDEEFDQALEELAAEMSERDLKALSEDCPTEYPLQDPEESLPSDEEMADILQQLAAERGDDTSLPLSDEDVAPYYSEIQEENEWVAEFAKEQEKKKQADSFAIEQADSHFQPYVAGTAEEEDAATEEDMRIYSDSLELTQFEQQMEQERLQAQEQRQRKIKKEEEQKAHIKAWRQRQAEEDGHEELDRLLYPKSERQ